MRLAEHFISFFSTGIINLIIQEHKGVQWLSGRVLDSRPKGAG